MGEIDVMELPKRRHHGLQQSARTRQPREPGYLLTQASGPGGGGLTAGFQITGEIAFGVDGVTHAVFTPQSPRPGGQWVFDIPMYALLNIAVGGDWPGPPGDSTPFPATMLADWFRYSPE